MKKWMSWMLVCALVCSLAAVPAAAADGSAAASAETEETVWAGFPDVQDLECQEAVEALYSMGIIGGYPTVHSVRNRPSTAPKWPKW